MKKRSFGRWIKVLSLLLAVLLSVLLLQEFVFREYWQYGQGDLRVKGFYREPKNSLDVVLIGDSTIYASYAPGYAYALAGFTSYDYAIGSNTCADWRIITEEITARQTPELIVVEVGGAQYRDLKKQHNTSSTLHVLIDNMPWSANRIRAIRDLAAKGAGQDVWEYVFPFIRHHGDWSSFGELAERAREMFAWKYESGNVLKGASTRVTAEPRRPNQMDVAGDRSTMELAPESEDILRAYCAFCREQGLNVLFIAAPVRVSEVENNYDTFRRENRAGEIVREYGFDFVNFHDLTGEMGIDFDRDYYNDGHLNYLGQQKFTAYFAKMLTEEYGVSGRALTERQRADWEKSAEYIGLLYEYADELAPRGEDVLLTERIEVMDALNALRGAER